MKIWKTQDKNRYTKLEGVTVAVRTVNKIPKANPWEGIDYERAYNIVKIQECKIPFFIDEEKNEYHIGDILKIF